MALQIIFENKHNGVWLKSGSIYQFNYTAWQNDREPLVVVLNSIIGTHPTTGNDWNLLQAINLNYIPRKDRKVFASEWTNTWKQHQDIKMTWTRVVKRFPYLQYGIRRYHLSPAHYISNLKEIKVEDFDKYIVKAWWKDYSSIIKRHVLSAIRKKGKI